MKFKLFYNGSTKKLDINCLELRGWNGISVLPEDLNKHIISPFPFELKEKLYAELIKLIPTSSSNDYLELENKIRMIQVEQKKLVHDLRKEINPKILQQTEEFKNKYPELFI